MKRTERESHAGEGYGNREASISFDDRSVDLQADQEEEEAETDVRDK